VFELKSLHLFLKFLIIIDLLWMFIMSGVWSHEKTDKEYWQSLSTLHSIIWFLVWCEILLTGGIIAILYIDHKQCFKENR